MVSLVNETFIVFSVLHLLNYLSKDIVIVLTRKETLKKTFQLKRKGRLYQD